MFSRMVTFFVLLSTTMPALANFKVETLDALQMETWRVRMGFHQLAVRGNAPEDIEALEAVLEQGGELISALKDEAQDDDQAEMVSTLEGYWSALSQRALDNPLASVGYADFNAFSEINSQTLQIVETLQRARGSALEGANDELYELGIRLLKISSEYIALATFPSAGINTGTTAEPMAFAEESMSMAKQIEALEASGTGGDAAARMLDTLKTRWSFIKGMIPMLDDPEAGRVPLLFYRYSSQTADDLLALRSS